jgi:lipopolysaccharide transport system permease protein
MKKIKELFSYREMLKNSIRKEVRGKYKGSFLGIIWSFLNPLFMVLVYSIVFPLILRVSEKNYPLFLVVGLIPWTYFTNVITQGTISIMANSNLIKKVYFPREILPISVATSGLINFLFSFVIVVVFLVVGGIGVSSLFIFLPLIIFVQYIVQLSIVFVLSSINVFFRDLEHIITVLIMILFYLTPIIYNPTAIPEKYRIIFNLNPMVHIITAYRSVLYYKVLPDFNALLIVGGFGLLSLLITYPFFNKLQRGFAEQI